MISLALGATVMHVLGSAVWIGGHAVLLGVVIPSAKRVGDVAGVLEFEKSYGRLGLASLIVQVGTGLFLTRRWVSDLGNLVQASGPAERMVLAKLALLALIVAMAGYARYRIFPTLSPTTLVRFERHAWIVTLLSVGLAICGVSIRMGGLL